MNNSGGNDSSQRHTTLMAPSTIGVSTFPKLTEKHVFSIARKNRRVNLPPVNLCVCAVRSITIYMRVLYDTRTMHIPHPYTPYIHAQIHRYMVCVVQYNVLCYMYNT